MRFCIFNSIEFDEKRTNYFGYEFQRAKDYYSSYHMLGYYFCDGDDLTIENLKLGTYQQAKQNCSKLLTPRFCRDDKVSDLLAELMSGPSCVFYRCVFFQLRFFIQKRFRKRN